MWSKQESAMSKNKVYTAIVEAVKDERLIEPFGNRDFRRACPGLGEGTYNAFFINTELVTPVANQSFLKKG